MTEQQKTNGPGAQVRPIAPPGAPTAPASVPQLEEADRLRVENIYLKLVNLELQAKGLDQQKGMLDMQKNHIVEQMKGLQAEMEKERVALSAKYGVDISRTSVKPDGTIKADAKPVAAVAAVPAPAGGDAKS